MRPGSRLPAPRWAWNRSLRGSHSRGVGGEERRPPRRRSGGQGERVPGPSWGGQRESGSRRWRSTWRKICLQWQDSIDAGGPNVREAPGGRRSIRPRYPTLRRASWAAAAMSRRLAWPQVPLESEDRADDSRSPGFSCQRSDRRSVGRGRHGLAYGVGASLSAVNGERPRSPAGSRTAGMIAPDPD